MLAGDLRNHPAFGASDERSPKGFYRTEYREIWPDIDPYIMTRTQLDEEILAGMRKYQKYFPVEGGHFGLALFIAVVAIVVVAAVAVVAAGSASAAGGASAGASAGASSAGATATGQASAAAAAGSTGASAGGAAASGYGAAAGGSAAAGGTTSAASFGSQAFAWAQKAAPYAKAAGAVMSASGNDDGDKLASAAGAVEGSSTATEAATKVFNGEMQRRNMELKGERAQEAMRERVKREQQSYAEWMRREAVKKKQHNPQVETTGQKNMSKWIPIATPFVLYALSQTGS